MVKVGIGIFLLWNTVTDLKWRTIHTGISVLFGLAGIIGFFQADERDFFSLGIGILAGIYMFFFSFLTREAVGRGDGFMVMAAGIWMREKTIGILMGAFLLAAAIGILKICLKKADRKSELPFAPFFFLSYLAGHVGGLM